METALEIAEELFEKLLEDPTAMSFLKFDLERWKKKNSFSHRGKGSQLPHDVGYGTTRGRIENLIINKWRTISTDRVKNLKCKGRTAQYKNLSREERYQDAKERCEAVLKNLAE